MGETRQINNKNWAYCFYNDRINLKNFDARLLKIDKKDYNDIYYTGYVTIKNIADYNNINSVNSLYLMINEMIGHFECSSFECNSVECNSIEEKTGNKYLVLDDVDENKEVLWVEINEKSRGTYN